MQSVRIVLCSSCFLFACQTDEGPEPRKAGAGDLTCSVEVTDPDTGEPSSKEFNFKTGTVAKVVEFSFKGTVVLLQRNPKTGATTLEIKESGADISGAVSGQLKAGEFLTIETINDFGAGDGSDTSVTCKLGGKKKKSKAKMVTCKTLGEQGDAPQVVTEAIPEAFGFDDTVLDVSVDKDRVIHVTTEEHNSIFAHGVGTRNVPFEYPNLSCFVE